MKSKEACKCSACSFGWLKEIHQIKFEGDKWCTTDPKYLYHLRLVTSLGYRMRAARVASYSIVKLMQFVDGKDGRWLGNVDLRQFGVCEKNLSPGEKNQLCPEDSSSWVLWVVSRKSSSNKVRLTSHLGTLAWFDEVHESTKHTNEGTNKESIGQSMDEYIHKSKPFICFIYYIMWKYRYIKCGMRVCIRTPIYSISHTSIYNIQYIYSITLPAAKNSGTSKSVVWWAGRGSWQDIKDPKPPEAEEELQKTGRVHGILSCHVFWIWCCKRTIRKYISDCLHVRCAAFNFFLPHHSIKGMHLNSNSC